MSESDSCANNEKISKASVGKLVTVGQIVRFGTLDIGNNRPEK